MQRKLRKEMTDAERILWRVLRAKQMAGFKFRRQHPYNDFILDFVCLERRIVIEVDGGQHDVQAEADMIRTDKLTRSGFRVLRFWNNEVINQLEGVKEKIWLELQEGTPPSPCPLPEGEE